MKAECEKCGYIGIPVIIHNDEKCSRFNSKKIYEITSSENKKRENKKR